MWHLLKRWDCLLKDLDSKLLIYTLVGMGQVIHFDMFTNENENVCLTLSPPSFLSPSPLSLPFHVLPTSVLSLPLRPRTLTFGEAIYTGRHHTNVTTLLASAIACITNASVRGALDFSHIQGPRMLHSILSYHSFDASHREGAKEGYIKCMMDGTV